MNLGYNGQIPASGNNPSADQPQMQINYANIATLIGVNHYQFQSNNGGLHLNVEMPALAAIPTIYNSSSGTLFTQKPGTDTDLYYTSNENGNVYQLSRVNDAEFSSFSTNPGWSFLPGGLIIQWGLVTFGVEDDHVTGTESFSINFTSAPYIVDATLQIADSSTDTASNTLAIRSLSSGSFKWVYNSSSGSGSEDFPGFYWVAIGI